MTEPRLTIGIPCKDRARFLGKAIGYCLAQTTPVRILVADQGGTDDVAKTMERYKGHPLVRHERTEAENLWQNWRAAADIAEDDDTEFFAFLQDDDQIGSGYAARIIGCFDNWKEADVWTARLMCADEDGRACHWLQNGPWMPLRCLESRASCYDSDILLPTSYFTAWALSPAVAFRRGDRFTAALERMPDDCALYNERLILAAMGPGGRFIADPCLAGYWVQHEANESRNQHPDQPRQTVKAIEWMDTLMDESDSEKALKDLDLWAAMMPVGHCYAWAECVAGQGGRWEPKVGGILAKHVKAALPGVTMPGMMPTCNVDGRAHDYEYARPSAHEVLLFD